MHAQSINDLPIYDPLTGARTSHEFAMLVHYHGLTYEQARAVLLVTSSYTDRDAKFCEILKFAK